MVRSGRSCRRELKEANALFSTAIGQFGSQSKAARRNLFISSTTTTTANASFSMTPRWQVFCLLLIWSSLTVLASGICCTCCLLPFWITGSVEITDVRGRIINSVSHLGLFRRCGYPTYRLNGDVEWTQGCGYYPAFKSVPHWVWRMALILLILAACLLVFLACFVVCAGTCTSLLRTNAKLVRMCSHLHLLAGSLCLGACLLYPFGWQNNSEIVQICGQESGTFKLGRCEVGWAYVLTIAGGVITVVLSGVPNLLQFLVQRTASPPLPPPLLASSWSDTKYPFASLHRAQLHSNPPNPHHPRYPWTGVGNSMLLAANDWGARRRPHSLVISADPTVMWELSRRLSCSAFVSIPEQNQPEMVSNKFSEIQSFATLPEGEATAAAAAAIPKEDEEESVNGEIIEVVKTDSSPRCV